VDLVKQFAMGGINLTIETTDSINVVARNHELDRVLQHASIREQAQDENDWQDDQSKQREGLPSLRYEAQGHN